MPPASIHHVKQERRQEAFERKVVTSRAQPSMCKARRNSCAVNRPFRKNRKEGRGTPTSDGLQPTRRKEEKIKVQRKGKTHPHLLHSMKSASRRVGDSPCQEQAVLEGQVKTYIYRFKKSMQDSSTCHSWQYDCTDTHLAPKNQTITLPGPVFVPGPLLPPALFHHDLSLPRAFGESSRPSGPDTSTHRLATATPLWAQPAKPHSHYWF